MPDKYEPVLVSVQDGVMRIQINRPEDKNRIDRFACSAISEALHAANGDPEIRVILFEGNREHFCTGGRVDAKGAQDEQDKYIASIVDMQQAMAAVTVPIVAAVEGDCTAGGHIFVGGADIAIASEKARFGFPEILRGGFPMMVMVSVIDHFPPKKLLKAFYTGKAFSAREVERFDLLTSVATDEEFWPTVNQMLDEIREKPRELMQIGRKAFYAMQGMDFEQRVAYGKHALVDVLKAQAKYQKDADS